MSGKFKKIIVLFLSVTMLSTLIACGKNDVISEKYNQPDMMSYVSTGLLAENSLYTLQWNDENKCVLLTDKETGHIWSTVPYGNIESEKYSYVANAPLTIEYYDTYYATIQTASAMDSVDIDLVSAEEVENGVKVTYYFEELKISIPVSYTLCDKSLSISLHSEEIKEDKESLIVSVSIAPYLCSVENSNDRSNYLFIPSGSGALMYTQEHPEGGSREFSQDVYGIDLTQMPLYSRSDDEAIRLPVFGVKASENALCAIIEDGAEASRIDASVGNRAAKYSTVYATFQLRSYNTIDKSSAGKVSEFYSVADELQKNKVYTVGYYPLKGDNANYSGMAACYRDYLGDSLINSDEVQHNYLVNIYGGEEINTFTLGVPHKKLQVSTTFKQAQEILDNLINKTDNAPAVLFYGAGETGITPGNIGGGFAFASELGGLKQYKALLNKCNSLGATLYTDFDVVFYSKNGNGFKTTADSAKSATLRPTYKQELKVNVRDWDSSKGKQYVLGREQLEKATDKLIKFTKNKVSGISLSSLGQFTYSDYANEQYFAQNGMSEQVISLTKKISNDGHNVHFTTPNAYAAMQATSISGVPLTNGSYDGFDEIVPFYSMVFHGTKPLYSQPLNTATDAKEFMLYAIEGGVAPSYSLIYEYDKTLSNSSYASFYGMVAESNYDFIKEISDEVNDFLESVDGVKIKSHNILDDGITKTVFENGKAVLVNHTDINVVIEEIEVLANSFVVI